VPATDGAPPSWPAETWAFCARTAAPTSGRRQLDGGELAGVEPDAHGVGRPEQLDVAHALHAAQRVDQRGAGVVAEIGAREVGTVGVERDDQREVLGRLFDGQALLLHLGRQEGGRGLQLVLHLDLGDVGVGAGRESQGDGGEAAAVARRGHVEQAVQALHLLLDHGRQHVELKQCRCLKSPAGDIDKQARKDINGW
jgi:hypothetical protein